MSKFGRGKLGMAAIVISMCVALRVRSAPQALPDASHVMAFLNQTIDWYHHLSVEEQLADQSTDVLFVYNNRQIADQVLGRSFDFARADAELLADQNPSAGQFSDGASSSQYQNLTQLASKAADRLLCLAKTKSAFKINNIKKGM